MHADRSSRRVDLEEDGDIIMGENEGSVAEALYGRDLPDGDQELREDERDRSRSRRSMTHDMSDADRDGEGDASHRSKVRDLLKPKVWTHGEEKKEIRDHFLEAFSLLVRIPEHSGEEKILSDMIDGLYSLSIHDMWELISTPYSSINWEKLPDHTWKYFEELREIAEGEWELIKAESRSKHAMGRSPLGDHRKAAKDDRDRSPSLDRKEIEGSATPKDTARDQRDDDRKMERSPSKKRERSRQPSGSREDKRQKRSEGRDREAAAAKSRAAGSGRTVVPPRDKRSMTRGDRRERSESRKDRGHRSGESRDQASRGQRDARRDPVGKDQDLRSVKRDATDRPRGPPARGSVSIGRREPRFPERDRRLGEAPRTIGGRGEARRSPGVDRGEVASRRDMFEMVDRLGDRWIEANQKKEEIHEDDRRKKEVKDLQSIMKKSDLNGIVSTEYLPDPKIVIEESKRSDEAERAKDDSKIPVWISRIDIDDMKWDPSYLAQDLKPEDIKERNQRFRDRNAIRAGECVQNLMCWINTHVALRSFESTEALQIISVFARIWANRGHNRAIDYMKSKIQKMRSEIMNGEEIAVGTVLGILDTEKTQTQETANLARRMDKMEIQLKAATSAAAKGSGKDSKGQQKGRRDRPWDGPPRSQASGSRGREIPEEYRGMKVNPVQRSKHQTNPDGKQYICFFHRPDRKEICEGWIDGTCQNTHLDTRIPKEREHWERVQKIAQDARSKRIAEETKKKPGGRRPK